MLENISTSDRTSALTIERISEKILKIETDLILSRQFLRYVSSLSFVIPRSICARSILRKDEIHTKIQKMMNRSESLASLKLYRIRIQILRAYERSCRAASNFESEPFIPIHRTSVTRTRPAAELTINRDYLSRSG